MVVVFAIDLQILLVVEGRCWCRSKPAVICRGSRTVMTSILIVEILTISVEASRSFPRKLETPPCPPNTNLVFGPP